MKFNCTKDVLLAQTQIVQKAIPARSTLPVLTGFLLETEKDQLKITANDYELGIECLLPVQIMEEGSIVLPAKYFSEIIRRLPDPNISIETNPQNHVAIIRSGSAEFTVHGMSAEDYPFLPQSSGSRLCTLKQNQFKKVIKQVIFATAAEETRPIFTGVLMSLKNGEINFVASDTHRLAFRKFGPVEADQENQQLIIPGKAMAELERILGGDEAQEVTIAMIGNQIEFSMPKVRVLTRTIEGQYPNYQQVIPTTYQTLAQINTQNFVDAVERASLFAREGHNNVIKLKIESEKLIITSNSPEVGKVYEEIEIATEGDELEIAFNAKYLADVLKTIETPYITFEMSGPLSPGIIRPLGDESYLYLVLPVRLN